MQQAGATLGPSKVATSIRSVLNAFDPQVPCAIANCPKLKDLLPFKGKDLKEANDYL